jgi:hypothetical protein
MTFRFTDEWGNTTYQDSWGNTVAHIPASDVVPIPTEVPAPVYAPPPAPRMLFSADTEGCLIAPAMQAPPLVCLQFAVDDGKEQLIHVRDPACYRTVRYALECGALWNFHNTAHDTASIMAQWPDLIDPVFDLYDRDLATCTIIRQKLIDIARGRFKAASKRGYNLALVAQALKIPQVVNKEDPWRMRYGELLDVPVSQWPPEALSYALGDVTAQRSVFLAQEQYADLLGDQFRQARAALWLKLMECRGVRVCPRRAEEYVENVRKLLEVDREVCEAAGLVRPPGDPKAGSRIMAAGQAYMVRICQETEAEDLPLTDKGEEQVRELLGIKNPQTPIPIGASWHAYQKLGDKLAICLNEDACKQHGDETLEAFQRYGTSGTQLSRAQKLLTAARAGVPIQPRFGTLQDSGRMSCSEGDDKKAKVPSALGSQLHNPAKDKKIKRRQPPGWIEDEAAQVFVNPLTGERKPSRFVRRGVRPLFQARPGYAFVSTDWEGAEASAAAQVCIWTPGIGFSRMGDIINAGGNLPTEYGAVIAGMSKEEAYAVREAGGDEKKAFDNGPRQAAKIALYGYLANMGPRKLRLQARKQYDVIMSLEQAADYKQKLYVFAPELKLLANWGSLQFPYHEKGKLVAFRQFWSGRIRGGLWYSALLNTTFQGLVADVIKLAGWRVCREMYTGRLWDNRAQESPLGGSYCWNGPHDEILSECPLDVLHDAGFRQAQIMIDAAREICPDVAYRCVPAAMFNWAKDAEDVYDARDRLVPWTPELKTVKRNGKMYVDSAALAA